MAKRYRYRLRDEVVNERYLVEEVYVSMYKLRLAEQYESHDKQEEINALECETTDCTESIDPLTVPYSHMYYLLVCYACGCINRYCSLRL